MILQKTKEKKGKTTMKRTIAFILSLVFILSTLSPCFADEPEVTSSVSERVIYEYDYYVAQRASASDPLVASTCSEQDAAILSNDIENELLRRSQLPDDELHAMGYTDEQIQLLREYNGERLEDYPQIRAATATVTASFSVLNANKITIKLRVNWQWTTLPLAKSSAIKDLLAIGWKGTDSEGHELNVAYTPGQSFSQVFYYESNTSTTGLVRKYDITCSDAYSNISSKFPMAYYSSMTNNSNWYARKGSFVITVERTGSVYIKEVAFAFAYAHSKLGINLSYTFKIEDMSFSFSMTSANMCTRSVRVLHDGTCINLS